ncbi:CDK2-associated and cullin domain-containing protein 1-like isoform X2 [Corticium candelabrum]|uniref:CDK2-associated and cullin domain-containing protein 1-like isoform X2 n=1 Tax=Corticium candelabrum TaxID=121492 RepID=UPI002E2614AB|nr:CDK2-associated and cullin domain-containing protein 1-like isoform X2 [Corticium candelabrum]
MFHRITSMDEYHLSFWPKLAQALTLILNQTPGQLFPISYEEIYSTVYKCVGHGFSETLYSQLLEHCKPIQDAVDCFLFILHQFTQAVKGIVPIFQYMNRFFILPRMQQDLSTILTQLFVSEVAESEVFIGLVTEALQQDLAVKPDDLMKIAQNLYQVCPEYARKHPALFVRFIPSLFPPSTLTQLAAYRSQELLCQQQLESEPGFTREQRERKRLAESEEPEQEKPALLQPPLESHECNNSSVVDEPMTP